MARLRAAGAVILGKTRMHEFAWGMVTPPTRNPWDPDRVARRLSGGSGAAVAGRLCRPALGSDTGGSIGSRPPVRIVGLKPNYGRVGGRGSCRIPGPSTMPGRDLTVADAALMLQGFAGPDAAIPRPARAPVPDYTPGSTRPSGLRVAVIRNHFFDAIDDDVAAAVGRRSASSKTGAARCATSRLPSLRHGLGAIYAIELASSTAYHDRSSPGPVAGFRRRRPRLVEMGRS